MADKGPITIPTAGPFEDEPEEPEHEEGEEEEEEYPEVATEVRGAPLSHPRLAPRPSIPQPWLNPGSIRAQYCSITA